MKNQIIEKIFRVVIYLRLSDEDGDNQESDSISNQRILNRGFLEGKQEFQIVKECVDDGYTGTNFNRPGFQEMMRLHCCKRPFQIRQGFLRSPSVCRTYPA